MLINLYVLSVLLVLVGKGIVKWDEQNSLFGTSVFQNKICEGKVSFSFGIALLSQFKPRKIVIPHCLPIVESLRIDFFFFFLKEEKMSMNLRDEPLTCFAEEIVLLTTHQEKKKINRINCLL